MLDEQTKADLQKRYAGFKQQIIQQLKDHDVNFAINGSLSPDNLQHVFNIWLKGMSTHVLTAMYGADSPRIGESIRISFGKNTTTEDVDYLCEQIIAIEERLKHLKQK